jgi:predicted nucleic acid-binding protein
VNAVFVDANVFLRFFTLDDRGHHDKAATLLRRAMAGELVLVTGPPVLFEIAWVLRAAYGQSREKILDVLSAILAMPGLHRLDGDTAEEAVDRARQADTGFADAYIAASALRAGAAQVATFNRRHFERLGVALADL